MPRPRVTYGVPNDDHGAWIYTKDPDNTTLKDHSFIVTAL